MLLMLFLSMMMISVESRNICLLSMCCNICLEYNQKTTLTQFLWKNFDQEHYDCVKCKFIFTGEKDLDSHHCGCHEENESNLVSFDVCEEIFECDKCDVVFVDKTDLRTHMN